MIVAREVILEAQRQKLDREPSIRDFSDAQLDSWIRSRMYDPTTENGVSESSSGSRSSRGPKSLL